MAFSAAWQMCSGVGWSGSPRLKSNTCTPAARNCRALAPAAIVAEGFTADASWEIVIMDRPVIPCERALRRGRPVRVPRSRRRRYHNRRTGAQGGTIRRRRGNAMRVAHFIQRYPPTLGGSEAYFQRLSRHLAVAGDAITVWTSTALDLEAFWSPRGRCLEPGEEVCDGVRVRRYPLWRLRGRRYLLKPLSLIPHRGWQCLTLPCNPIAPAMWRDVGRTREPYDVVHASAFPYAFPVACGLRLARRLGVPFLLTPFLHLGDPADPRDRTRRSYLSPALRSLLAAADQVFTQTPGERDAVVGLGVPPERVVLQGLGVDPAESTGGDRARVRAEWGVAEDEVVVGHLANASVEKGTVDLLRAAEVVWRRGRRFPVVLAGPEMPNFRRHW